MMVSHPATEASPDAPLRLFLIAGEHSGDALGAKLIAALRDAAGRPLELKGVGGPLMADQGCASEFPLSEMSIMSPLDILPRLRSILRRIRETARSVIAFDPEVLIILDSPEFTHQVAKRVRRRNPRIPIVDYVSPSVWAWRPWRARSMRRYVDHVLGILPFEPGVHQRLGGPACSYVGHPLVEDLDWIDSLDPESLREELGIPQDREILVVLPGSRSSEIKRLMRPFGEAIRELAAQAQPFEVILPAVESVRDLIDQGLATWPIRPHIITSRSDKFRAFKLATAALAASGTVTLELALAGTPMVVAYIADALATKLRFLMIAPSAVLPNLIIGENVFPELLHERCNGQELAAALLPLMQRGNARDRQIEGTKRVAELTRQTGESPSNRAAGIVLDYARQRRSEADQRFSVGT